MGKKQGNGLWKKKKEFVPKVEYSLLSKCPELAME
jgi:hypothetical protein